MPRAVLDPNVLVSALIAPGGPSAQLLSELRQGAFELIASPRLMAELDEVLRRDKFRTYAEIEDVDAYVELIRSEAVIIEDPPPSPDPICSDPDDEYLIDLAREAGVEALVSGDPHLLELASSIPVLTPRAFLDEVNRASA